MDEIYDPEVILISDGLNLNPKMVQDCFNRNAHFVADLVALICIKSNIPLTVGVDPIRKEPNTEYGRMLQKVLKILGIKGRFDNEPHWRRLAENAKLKHKSATGEK